ncbi:7160_t:CDS:2, partial [Acaulospora colombiana]
MNAVGYGRILLPANQTGHAFASLVDKSTSLFQLGASTDIVLHLQPLQRDGSVGLALALCLAAVNAFERPLDTAFFALLVRDDYLFFALSSADVQSSHLVPP